MKMDQVLRIDNLATITNKSTDDNKINFKK